MKSCYIDKETRTIADLCDYHGRGMLVTRINVPRQSRGQGHARKLLARILADADAERVTLFLEILPSGGLTFKQLEAWYTRRGFQRWDGIYRRLPHERQAM